jgi:hypothetical protein
MSCMWASRRGLTGERRCPDDLFETFQMRDFLEWSALRAWMKSWLQYSHWYYSTALAPDVTLEAFFSAEVVNRNWKIDRTDLVRFGLLWKVYDLVAIRGLQVANIGGITWTI